MKSSALIFLGPLIIIIVSIPMVLNMVPKNNLYGYRTQRTMSGSDAEWYTANHLCGLALLVAEIITLLVFAIVPHFPIRREFITPIRLAVYLASIVVAMIYTALRTP